MSNARRFRLAAVTSHPVQYQAPLFQRLARQPQIDLTVYYRSDSSLRGEVDPGFGVPVKWDRPLLDGYRHHFLRNPAEMVGELFRARYDAVFIHSYATATSLMAYVGALLSGTPVLLRTESELIRPRSRRVQALKSVFLRTLFRRTAAFLSIGSHNRAFYNHYGVREEHLYHTPYSVDNEFFVSEGSKWLGQKSRLKAALGFRPCAPVVVFSGKLIPLKRPMDLLQAYRSLVKEGVQAGLLYIGDGELRLELERVASEHGLTYVKVTGFRNQTELPRYYGAGDVFVLSSEFDPWGLVVNEAMLHSMPVIVSDRVGAGKDLVQEGITGFVYPVGDVSRLTEYLRQLLGDECMRERMGQAARARIDGWSLDACVSEVCRAVCDVVR